MATSSASREPAMTRTHHDNPTCHATRRDINSPPTTSARRLGHAAAPTLSAGDRSRFFNDGRRGFTIIELLVAIAIASLLLFMVNFIFNDATRAVSRGIALSDIIANTRGANDQFAIDASVMVGPSAAPASEPGGFLVIANHEIDAKVRRGPALDEQDVTVRADQLCFIRKRDDGGNLLLPIAPEANSTFTADFEQGGNDYFADHVKVWYGHVALTGSDGVLDSGEGLGGGANRIANDWVLGRQAVFLVDEGQGATMTNVHAENATSAATVVGYVTTKPNDVDSNMYAGLTDMAGQILGPEPEAGSINEDLAAATDTADYQLRAYSYTYISRRLWANDAPRIDTSDNLYSIAAWQVAQQHPIFMAHASDFIVEFAADTDLDGRIDTDDHDNDNNTPEIIKWYVHDDYANEPGEPGYNPDRPATYPLPAGTYRTAVYDDTVAVPAEDNGANDGGAFVWRHDDANNVISNSTDGPDADSEPDQPSLWPYLIRIRYRMHDSRGVIESGDDQHGMWFEHVIKVNRP